MRFLFQVLWASPLVTSATAAYTPASTLKTDILAAEGLLNLAINQVELALEGQQGSCNLANAAVRREW